MREAEKKTHSSFLSEIVEIDEKTVARAGGRPAEEGDFDCGNPFLPSRASLPPLSVVRTGEMERLGTAVAPHGLYHFGKATGAALNTQPQGHHVLPPAHRDHEIAYAVPPERKQPAGFRVDDARHNSVSYNQAGGFTQTPLVFDPGTQPPKRPPSSFLFVMRCSHWPHTL